MRLRPLPAAFVDTRDSLHQVAFYALAPARYQAVGRMGLRPTPGGLGTPEFDGKVARVEGDLLVYEEGDNIATRTITTVRDAAAFFGRNYEATWYQDFHDPPPPADPDRPLSIELGSARALAQWFAYGFAVLERLRSQAAREADASEPQLWPEHFDAAIEMGSEEAGTRASFGASPGDPNHAEPYLYVSAWGEIDRTNSYWNDDNFNGASLSYGDLVDADDPMGQGLGFLIAGYRTLRTESRQ